jgi:perosamine synthetase
MNDFIPVCEPSLIGNEKKYLMDAIETGWISSAGKYIPAFEEKFAAYCGVKQGPFMGIENDKIIVEVKK